MGVAQQQPVQPQPEPDPPHTEPTYVLGWPKGRETIGEDEFERSGAETGESGAD
jgi:hypothetical protein